MFKVLSIGFTAEASDLEASSMNVEELRNAIEAADAEVRAAGYDLVRGWIQGDHDASVAAIEHQLAADRFDVVLIGGGVRGRPQFTELFEQLVNAVHRLAPDTRFAFNADPPSTLAALRRTTNNPAT